jgi:D-alanyl-D-alanine carboxypeptidase
MGKGWVRLVGLLAGLTMLAATSSASAFTPAQEQRMQRIAERYRAALDYPGLAIGVWQQGNGGFTTAVGAANLRTGRPLRVTDHFHIGSVTKTMTATLALQLVQRGKLKLHDSIDKYVNGVPLGRLITVRMLLNHTSGLRTGPGSQVGKKLKRNIRRDFTPNRLLRWSVRAPRYGFPGEVWGYSNTGYWLLGKIVKKLTHKPLPLLYRQRIFDRVGMSDTAFRPPRPVPKPAAHGYLGGRGGQPFDVTRMNWSWAWTAGAATSTIRDLGRWAPAVATGDGLLDADTQAKRLQCVPIGRTSGIFAGVRYCLGLFKWPLPSGKYIGHNGEGPGYDTESFYSPDSKVTIVAFGTTDTGEDPVKRSRLDDIGLNGIVPLLAGAATGTG